MTRQEHFQTADENLKLAQDTLRQEMLRGHFGLAADLASVVKDCASAWLDLEETE
jgi:hypothetical protein